MEVKFPWSRTIMSLSMAGCFAMAIVKLWVSIVSNKHVNAYGMSLHGRVFCQLFRQNLITLEMVLPWNLYFHGYWSTCSSMAGQFCHCNCKSVSKGFYFKLMLKNLFHHYALLSYDFTSNHDLPGKNWIPYCYFKFAIA